MQVSKQREIDVKEVEGPSAPPVDPSGCAVLAVKASPHANIQTNAPSTLPDTRQRGQRIPTKGRAGARVEKQSTDSLKSSLLGEQ